MEHSLKELIAEDSCQSSSSRKSDWAQDTAERAVIEIAAVFNITKASDKDIIRGEVLEAMRLQEQHTLERAADIEALRRTGWLTFQTADSGRWASLTITNPFKSSIWRRITIRGVLVALTSRLK